MNPQLVIQLNFYDNNTTTLTRYVGDGTITHPVTVEQIASVMDKTRQRVSTGWLTANIINWGIERDNRIRCVAHFPATTVNVQVAGQDETWAIPIPRTVMVGHGDAWWLYALKHAAAIDPNTPLYECPAPNVHTRSGNICRGNVPFPSAEPKTMQAAFDAFWGSQFNQHLSAHKCVLDPRNVLTLWRELIGQRAPFPDDELLPAHRSLASLIH